MHAFPPCVTHELPGWTLFWADLEVTPGAAGGAIPLLERSAEYARGAYALEKLAAHAAASAVRKLFRAAGCDPTRYRPSSEALVRRLLKGEDLPPIHPLVDLNNSLSVRLAVPACVMDAAAVVPPFVLRAGTPGESMLSLRGPFDLAAKPLLADLHGPFGTPITDSERVRVKPETVRAWLVAYLPAGVVGRETAERELAALLGAAPVARLHGTAVTGP